VVSAEKGIETRIRDIAAEPLGKALAHCKAHFDRKARSVGERHVFKARSRVSGGLDLTGFNTMDLIIEAVPEVLTLKQEVFAQLEVMVPRTTILASNTSALPITRIAERMQHRDRVIGLHFFSPVSKMPLLEIVKTAETSPQTLATCLRYAAQIGKTPIVVNDGPGFYTTRVLGFYLMAALEMVQALDLDVEQHLVEVRRAPPDADVDDVGALLADHRRHGPQRARPVHGADREAGRHPG